MVLPRFLTELKRRNVYRAALVYAGVGWLILEAADVILPRLGLPDWTVNAVLAVVLLGFPLALVFAWIFDLNTQGIVRTEPLSQDAHHQISITSAVEFVVICTLVATVGYLYVDRLSLQKRLVGPETGQPAVPNPEQYRAIAVLPFADMSEAGDQDWFAEGIAEELLHGLARVDELHVMARTSSFAFKGTDKTIAEIAEILNVQAVLEGSVRRSGDRVRITAQLIDASSGYHIWSGSYERELTDIFQLQDELAMSVVQALRVELGVESTAPLVAEETNSLEAYNWFLRGRSIWTWDDPNTTEQGISYFEKAVETDPDYARAWGHLAFAHVASMAWEPSNEAGPAAILASDRAVALDPEQSEALAAQAVIASLLHRDWETAGRLYLQAMASADNSNAMVAYSMLFLQHIGRPAHAIRLQSDAEKRDPLHSGYKGGLAEILRLNGDTELATIKAREALELNPGHVLAMGYLIHIYTDTDNFAALQLLIDDIPPALQERPEIMAPVGRYHARRGDEAKARRIYRELAATFDNLTPVAMLYTAELAASLGEIEESIDLQERTTESGTVLQFWNKLLYRNNEVIRENPRYQELLKRMGLDDESVAELNSKLSFE
ncbi:MAG: hypothetical protein GWP63_03840 [Haliea sp.]|jgi:TolB-like protein|nr:hypothetical protein [Haliea sp.]